MSDLLIKAEGEAFEKGKYDLRIVESLLTNYRQVLDQTIPYCIGYKTLSETIKHDMRYEIEIREGSLEVLLNFAIENADTIQENLPLLGALGSDGGNLLSQKVTQIIDGVLKFRRIWSNLLNDDIKPKIQNQPQINLHLNDVKNDHGTINVNPIILMAAEGTKSPIDRIVNKVDGRQLENVQIQSDAPDLRAVIKPSDKNILGSQKEELPNQIDIPGRLDVVNYRTRKGKLSTSSGKYPVSWEENIRSTIHDLADKDGIMFSVRPVIDHRKFRNEPVGFHIIRCWNPQLPML